MTKESLKIDKSKSSTEDYEYEEYEDFGSSSKQTFVKNTDESDINTDKYRSNDRMSSHHEEDIFEPGQSIGGLTIPPGYRAKHFTENRAKFASSETRSLKPNHVIRSNSTEKSKRYRIIICVFLARF